MELCGAEHPDQSGYPGITCNQQLGHQDPVHIAALGVNHMVSWPNLEYINGPKNLQEFNSAALGMAQNTEDETHALEPDRPGTEEYLGAPQHSDEINSIIAWLLSQDGYSQMRAEVLARLQPGRPLRRQELHGGANGDRRDRELCDMGWPIQKWPPHDRGTWYRQLLGTKLGQEKCFICGIDLPEQNHVESLLSRLFKKHGEIEEVKVPYIACPQVSH